MSRIRRGILIALGVLLVGIQLVRPSRTNAPIDASRTIEALVTTPPEVASIFERSCNDCHSSQTHWPWYSQIAPVSWLVARDVNDGRRHLNFSDWAAFDRKKAEKRLGEICEEVSAEAMPLPSYLWMHRTAKLSPADVRALCEWSEAARAELETDGASSLVSPTSP